MEMGIKLAWCLLLVNFPLKTLADFVCYHDEYCADNETRPVFVLGSSLADCCGTPDVRAAWELPTELCTNCGPPSVRRVSQQFVVITPRPNEVALEIEATGYTAITWLVNGTDMHDFERVSLDRFSKMFVLVNATLADAGVYEADVHTLDGTVEMVLFYVFPFRRPDVSATALTDDFIYLTCAYTGFPPPVAHWIFQNGSAIASVSNGEDSTPESPLANTLDARLPATNEYLELTCQATVNYNNSTFSTNSTTYVNEERPRVTGINSVTAVEGQSANLTCSAQGQPLPSLSWLFNGVVLTPNETISISSSTVTQNTIDSVLTLGAVSYSLHRSIYTCLAENFVGEDMIPVELSVLSPPSVIIHPVEAVLNTQDPMNETVFTCTAVGNGLPEIRWERNGEPLSGVCIECDLRLAGEACETEPLGEAGSPQGEAPLLGEAPFLGEAGEEPINNTGHSLDMKGADFEEDDERLCYITTYAVGADKLVSELIIPISGYFDETTRFTCIGENGVENTVNKQDTASAELVILLIPTVVVDLISETVSELETFSLSCLALNDPTPTVSWLKDNTLLSIEDLARVSVTLEQVAQHSVMSVLTIVGADPEEDSGVYQCRIDNFLGTGLAFYDTISITVEVRDDCLTSVQGDLPLRDEGVSSPCLNGGVCIDELGDYSCRCTADFTGKNCTIPVTVQEEPSIRTEPENREIDYLETVRLYCEAQGTPAPLYSWFKDGLFVRNVTQPYLELVEVEPSQRGLYHCVAVNSAGSIQSRSGLLTIDGVFQYSAEFTCNQEISYRKLIEEMSASIAREKVADGLAEIISVTMRPVPPTSEPILDQFLVTLVANGVSSFEAFDELYDIVAIAVSRLNCTLINLIRFDGCPNEQTALNEEYGVYVAWPESEIGNELVTVHCPCGKLDASDYGSPNLTRMCGGSYTYGAEWKMVDSTQCNYTDNTYKLCRVPQLIEEEQATELASVTERADEFRPLDFVIANLVLQKLAEVLNLSNKHFQGNFTRSYSNLLKTGSDTVREGQRDFGAASNILNSLSVFGMRLDLLEETGLLLQEDRVVVGVEVFTADENGGAPRMFQPELHDSELVEITTDPIEMPLDAASISLSEELLNKLGLQTETRNIFNVVQNQLFFVTENETDDVIGNLVISASIFTGRDTLMVEDLPNNQAVIITFNVTSALNYTYVVRSKCVYWEHSHTTETYGRWSEKGCEVLRVAGRQITCRCNHLTHFGVLMDIEPDDRDPSVEFSLQIISYVGCLVSISLLAILLFTYLCSSKLRGKVIGRMLINSCCALIGVYTTFLLAIHGDYYREDGVEWFCYLVSGFLQYFLLAYFLWTTLEAFQIGLKLVKVFGSDIKNYVLKSALIAWGVPLVIVGLSAGFGIKYDMFAVKREENIDNLAGGTKTTIVMCRAEEIVFYVGILAPFVLSYTFNLIIYFIIVASLGKQVAIRTKGSTLNKDMRRREYKRLGIVAFFLAIMFGLAWIFAILVAIPNEVLSYVAQYLFSIFIGFQGLLYFVMHVLRSPDARRFWLTLLFKPCPGKMPDSFKTWTTTSPQHVPTKPANLKSNPLYSSRDHLQGESAFNTLEREPRDVPDLAAGLSTYSLASQTLQIDFTLLSTIDDDDGDSCTGMDLQELIATKFSDPNAPGVAVSSARMPPMTSSAKSSPLVRHIETEREKEEKKDLWLRLESEEENAAKLEVMDLAYDKVLANEDKDSISRKDDK